MPVEPAIEMSGLVTIYIVPTLIILGIMIVIHELGHHLAAKMFGVRVEVFSVGFGKRLFGFLYGGTDYRLSALPFGGYVKMAGMSPIEDKVESLTGDPGEFMSHPRWQRVVIALAGPAMNIVFAVALFTGIFMNRFETPRFFTEPAKIAAVNPGSPAEAAGLKADDEIVLADGNDSPTWEELRTTFLLNASHPVDLTVRRGNDLKALTIVPAAPEQDKEWANLQGLLPRYVNVVQSVDETLPAKAAGLQKGDEVVEANGRVVATGGALLPILQQEAGKPVRLTVLRGEQRLEFNVAPVLAEVQGETKYRIGITSQPEFKVEKLTLLPALSKGVVESQKYSLLIFSMLRKLVERKVSIKQMEGPLGITRAVGDQVKTRDWISILGLTAIISLNLGIFNLLPIPILDGGLILLTCVEGLMRRDIDQRIKERIYQTAFVFLIMFAAVVMYNDVTKFFPGAK
ncbi:MAG: RIP metalloprotease RseP [Acidobacteriales bacterium]|nr:RIP metalloprotease RseP [Terriglobales bacterium]